MTKRTRDLELEERTRRLEGHTLRGIARQGEATIFLELDDGRVEISAEDAVGIGHGVGIWLRPRKVVDRAYGPIVAGGEVWNEVVGSVVTRAAIAWANVWDALRSSLAASVAIHADYLRRTDYPARLELTFASALIAISAARVDERGVMHPMEPGLVVTRERPRGPGR